MKRILCPSMMCAQYSYLADEVRMLDEAGADIFHIDIMDGAFVPNFAMGLEDFKCIRQTTKKLIDVHLMVENPETAVRIFTQAGADILYVHAEYKGNIAEILENIREEGASPGIAVNPDTTVEQITKLLPLVDYILIMTVHPGFAGQTYIELVNTKLQQLVELKDKYHFYIIVDGAISPEKIRNLSEMGVDGFVLGTSALFGKEKSYCEILNELRN